MPSVLVTGAARGIGRSIVTYLAARGWDVVAGVRSAADAEAITSIDPRRVTAVMLDVTDAAHVAALDEVLPERLDGVVNNAGIVVSGPMETVTSDDWRKQFDVNVIGQMAVTRAVLPRLRASQGRVVFVSSVNGRMAMPLIGAYAASKFAVEAAADALRMELRPWRIAVAIIEPAQTDTDMWRTADDMVVQTAQAMSEAHRALYSRHIAGMKKMVPMSQRMATPAEGVAVDVLRALTDRRPRARYVVGTVPKLQVAVLTKLPTSLRDFVLRKVASQP